MRFIKHSQKTLRPLSLLTVATRQNSLERAWFIAVLVWSILRIVFADVFFAQYGVNIWIFAACEFVSSPIFARATAKMVIALSTHQIRNSMFWGVITLTSFAAPDVYLLSAGKNLPWMGYLVVIGIMTVAGTMSLIKMRRKARDMRISHV
jgi:hypothetical protein